MKQPSRFKVGLLFLLGVLFSVGVLIWKGTSETFGNMKSYAAYFDSSVQGLNAGSEVSYKGVRIGRVDSKSLAPDGRLVRIGLSLQKDFSVEQGQVLSLAQQGLAGSTYLELQDAPGEARLVKPPFDFETGKPVIPTLSGGRPGMLETARQLSGKLQALPLDDLITQWTRAGREVEQIVADNDIHATLENLRQASNRADAILQTLSRPGTREDMQQTLADLSASAGSIRRASADLEQQLGALSPDAAADISAGTRKTLDNLQVAVRRLNLLLPQVDRLVRSLRREPGQVTVRHKQQEPFNDETE